MVCFNNCSTFVNENNAHQSKLLKHTQDLSKSKKLEQNKRRKNMENDKEQNDAVLHKNLKY